MLRKVTSPYKVSIRRTAASVTAADSKKAILRLIRFDPETNKQRVESYEYDKHHDYMVLDLITAVKAHQDPTLAFRASCCEGVCGSCAMNINGVNSLACITFSQQVTTVGPLPNFPVIKDFVVDLRHFFRQYAYIRPFVRNVNLDRSRLDNIVERYKTITKVIHGVPSDDEAQLAQLESKSGAQTDVMALLQLLDAVCESGNVTHLIRTLEALQERGMQLDQGKVKALIEETLQNYKKRKLGA
ncbi:electron transfer protein, putative [Trypanosoma equiperdum]|uniref:Electron transfer protein, putative n=4 Tax=Trypanozoon TaxID=39700 RepID=Q57YX5_TRYB2|nr:electron transfer protein, putative [Trypanosoma brucei gambiense DAL972]XP_847169.1 electron transfer protein, putative [Trypanosoma brucei brucei TREU927]AAX79657.1 electron transfer protein, putative [Trypanosoma brucei]RHW71116.1 electron transfer protein [Trypanosoma brucei equiperdum]SCU66140.1 electron transfer protein, putative [Trypanosoma equiperdum]AAZ13103.1 electron transfer protein, putative [Trypanosoma brucei brucei TREU927]CBH13366.1 electron transfer protein, putative [Tr|eukprot:XP_011775643.1 electron transfer protein, putative [Trypanosoma brucei gambiense DAL972]